MARDSFCWFPAEQSPIGAKSAAVADFLISSSEAETDKWDLRVGPWLWERKPGVCIKGGEAEKKDGNTAKNICWNSHVRAVLIGFQYRVKL